MNYAVMGEHQYESAILQIADVAFPGWKLGKFNDLVESEKQNRHPDLVLVDTNFRGWVVVEVEHEHHSWANHIYPQMRDLSRGKYTQKHAESIAKKLKLPLEKVSQMVSSVDPTFLVIIPNLVPEKVEILKKEFGVEVCFLNVFESAEIGGDRCFTLHGAAPGPIDEGLLCKLKPMPVSLRTFQIQGGWVPDEDRIRVNYGGGLVDFKYFKTGEVKILEQIGPTSNFPRPENMYKLSVNANREYLIEKLESNGS